VIKYLFVLQNTGRNAAAASIRNWSRSSWRGLPLRRRFIRPRCRLRKVTIFFLPFRPAMSASRSPRSMTSFDRGHLRRGIHRGEASLLPAVRRLGEPRGRDLAVARTCSPPLARGEGAWLRERNLFGHRSAPSPKNSRRLASAATNALPRSGSTSASDLISGHAPRYSCSKLARR